MPIVSPPPNLVQIIMNGTGQIVFGLDQQGSIWTGIIRPVPPPPLTVPPTPSQGDGQYMITWTKMSMSFVAP